MAARNQPKKFKKGPMDVWFAKQNSFVSKNPQFFKGYSFTFEGYVPDLKKALEVVVKDMSARIDDLSGNLIMDHFTFASANDDKPKYSIAYLAYSIRAGRPLDINDFKFGPLKENKVDLGCNCLDIRTILNARYWPNNKFHKVLCSLCYEAERFALAAIEFDEVLFLGEYSR